MKYVNKEELKKKYGWSETEKNGWRWMLVGNNLKKKASYHKKSDKKMNT